MTVELTPYFFKYLFYCGVTDTLVLPPEIVAAIKEKGLPYYLTSKHAVVAAEGNTIWVVVESPEYGQAFPKAPKDPVTSLVLDGGYTVPIPPPSLPKDPLLEDDPEVSVEDQVWKHYVSNRKKLTGDKS